MPELIGVTELPSVVTFGIDELRISLPEGQFRERRGVYTATRVDGEPQVRRVSIDTRFGVVTIHLVRLDLGSFSAGLSEFSFGWWWGSDGMATNTQLSRKGKSKLRF